MFLKHQMLFIEEFLLKQLILIKTLIYLLENDVRLCHHAHQVPPLVGLLVQKKSWSSLKQLRTMRRIRKYFQSTFLLAVLS